MPFRIFILSFVFCFQSALADDPRGDHPDAPSSTAQEQLAKFHVPPGFEVQLVAAEPQIKKPINLTFDAAGRLWVTGSEMYPWPASVDALGQPIPDFERRYAEIAAAFRVGNQAPPISPIARDTVRILSDFAPDGGARKIEIFADGLNVPSGVQPLPRAPGAKGDTAIVYSIPNIWRLEDTDGDGKADKREVLYGMFGYLDTHGGSSSYLYWIDGWIYGTHGFRNHSEVRDRNGKLLVLESGNTYRFRPDGSAFEIYTHGQTNPFGLTVDPLGNFYSADSHSKPVYMLLRGGYYEGIGKQHDGLGFAPRITDDDHGSSAIAGIAYYADDKFPEEFRGNLFNGNPVTQKINRDKLEWHGATPRAIRQPDFLTCDDPWFRPVQIKLGPDGALYIADFYNPIIGHYEFPLADPRRDHTHGRIWRVVWRGEQKEAPASALPNLAKREATDLVKNLADPSLEIRRLAANELVDRIGKEKALPALHATARTDSLPGAKHPEIASWVQERLGAGEDIEKGLNSPEDGVAVQALQILAERHSLTPHQTLLVAELVSTPRRPLARVAAEIFALHPSAEFLESILTGLQDTPVDDPELAYAWRMALRNCLTAPDGYQRAAEIAKQHPEKTEPLASVSMAVKSPEAAAFLIAYLDRSKLEPLRASEYLKHALLYLPEENLAAAITTLPWPAVTPLSRKVTLAASLEDAARQRNFALPAVVAAWSQDAIFAALAGEQDDLAKIAVAAVRDVKSEAKLVPLTKIVRQDSREGSLRSAALEATANLPSSRDLLTTTFADSPSMSLRKRAAELLAQNGLTDDVLAALPHAPGELAISIAGALAKTDTGAIGLLRLIETGRVSPRLLLNRAVSGPWTARPKALQDRATVLTRDLPPEDVRLNAVIAERAAAFAKAQPDTAHGGQIFQQTCAVCHRFRNAGGNVGPNLDGVIARGPARLIEDILDPSRNVDPLFRQTTIETVDGEVLIGTNLREQGDAVILGDLTGKDLTIQKNRIKKQTISPLSLMPPIFEAALPPADFNDLLGYLLSPSGTPR